MNNPQFERLRAEVLAAPMWQILELEAVIRLTSSQHFAELALARRTACTMETRACPHCHNTRVVLHGKDQNGRQRFRCRNCRKTYNILTGTAMARARKPDNWARYLDCMTEHMSVRKIVASGIRINAVTACAGAIAS